MASSSTLGAIATCVFSPFFLSRNVNLENYAGDRLTPASLFVHVKYVEQDEDDADKKKSSSASNASGKEGWMMTGGRRRSLFCNR